ncbi:MAG: adenosylcobinamide amidohydrolase [Magnetococcales bacterium]|nr:adenosylcobinamide amidohydrolase [Magnetococcales bacterium]
MGKNMVSLPPLNPQLTPPWLLLKLHCTHTVLSWAINKPGYVETDKIAWLQVKSEDLPIDLNPKTYLQEQLSKKGLTDSVTLMTSRNVAAYKQLRVEHKGVVCQGIITLDLGNGSHVGYPDTTSTSYIPGTINIFCQTSQKLDATAMLEAISIISQGRTAALTEIACQIRSCPDPVTGTGTDNIALAIPTGDDGSCYAGLHTPAGQAIGKCAYELTKIAAIDWMTENGL